MANISWTSTPRSVWLDEKTKSIMDRAIVRVGSHRPSSGSAKPLEPWIFLVIGATLGLFASLALNLGASVQLALNAGSPAFPHLFDQRYLIVSTWGFIVPMVWGFSARWLPVFMGLRPLRNSFLLVALGLNTVGVILGYLEYFVAAGIFLLAGAATAVDAIPSMASTSRWL